MNKGVSPLVFGGLLAAFLLTGVVFVVRSTMADTGSIDAAAARGLSSYGAANVAAAADALPTFAAPSLDPVVTIVTQPEVYAMPTQQVVTVDLPTATMQPTWTPLPTWTPAPTWTPTITPTPVPRWRTEMRGEWRYIELPIGWMPCYLWSISNYGQGYVYSVAHVDWAGYIMGLSNDARYEMYRTCKGM